MNVKKLLKFLILPLLVLGVVSCASTDEDGEESFWFSSEPDNQNVPIEELVNYIMSQIDAEPRCRMSPNPAYAESGFSVFIGKEKTPVAFYKYNWKLKKMRKKLARIKETGYLYLTFIPYKAEVNGCYVMINHDKCSEQDKLLELFRKF